MIWDGKSQTVIKLIKYAERCQSNLWYSVWRMLILFHILFVGSISLSRIFIINVDENLLHNFCYRRRKYFIISWLLQIPDNNNTFYLATLVKQWKPNTLFLLSYTLQIFLDYINWKLPNILKLFSSIIGVTHFPNHTVTYDVSDFIEKFFSSSEQFVFIFN